MMLISSRVMILGSAWVILCFAAIFGQASWARAEDAKPAATTATTTTTTPAPTTTTTTPAKKKTATPSPCKGLDNAACTANAICTWYKEAHLKSGKTRKAHCQRKPTHHAAKKKASPT
jgi:hypothetical protein